MCAHVLPLNYSRTFPLLTTAGGLVPLAFPQVPSFGRRCYVRPRRGRVCAWFRIRTPRSTCATYTGCPCRPAAQSIPVPPRDRIGAVSRFRCRRVVSAARRIHGQDSWRFTLYTARSLPCIAQGSQSSPGRGSLACFYPILSWAVYRTRFLASEGLPACLPLPVFPGCHLPVS
ncbi:hypothetical protein ANT_21900 [Anaerolinea thermophila UNI-1]|uniref:Uncharacterized protein n=1 Tax=Anaerolinea thermophila (strain DSM 14523 / JCM 11388 / NBRC 100420 / UNI-1) TaxID=926569 RepID=E8MXY5_ANATU|nr:hypothetical protein ANT_21900 [Anaerolinea thermophila UNI-1]